MRALKPEAPPSEAPRPLSRQEEVLISDTWNKILVWEELAMETFVERLLVEAPELLEILGDSADDLGDTLLGLLDLCVRSLRPSTERAARAGVRSMQPAPLHGCATVEAYGAMLADLGLRPRHWTAARRVWMWTLTHVPSLEAEDHEEIRRKDASAHHRFFTNDIMAPMLVAIRAWDELFTPANIDLIRASWGWFHENQHAAGIDLRALLLESMPEVLSRFARGDVDRVARHLLDALDLLVQNLHRFRSFIPALRELGRAHLEMGVPSAALSGIIGPIFTLFERHMADFTPELEGLWHKTLLRAIGVLRRPIQSNERLAARAKEWLDTIAGERGWDESAYEKRLEEIQQEIRVTGTYTHTYEELSYGARVAWRNTARCIGRVHWNNMLVRDRRDASEPEDIFQEVLQHLDLATRGGSVQTVMTVFRPRRPGERWGPRIWNPQLVRYAAYEQEDGAVVGDPANLGLTKALVELGWRPPAVRSQFDVLPLCIQMPGRPPQLFEVPGEHLVEVPIKHPTAPAFSELGLRWCAVPALSSFRLEVGGISYTCCPFNGWFMETEVARDLFDTHRYNKAVEIARALGLDTSSELSLWRDRAFLELNVAVLHSFREARVSMVDHHTASRQFLAHDQRERKAGRECPAEWSWIVPPLSGSVCPVFHHDMRSFWVDPQYHPMATMWAVQEAVVQHAGLAGLDEGERARSG